MIHFIFGPDQFRARRRVGQLRQEFSSEDSTQIDLTQVVASTLSVGQLRQLFTGATLFANQRLVVLEDLLASPQLLREEFLKLVSAPLDPSLTLVLFETSEPDKRLSLYKWANQNTTAERFDLLSGVALQNHVLTMSQAQNLSLTPVLTNRLIALVGADLWRMEQELAKLRAYATTHPLTSQAIDQLVNGNLENDIFSLLTSINRRDLGLAHRQLANLTYRGEDPIGILAVLTWQIRNLIRIADLNTQQKSAGEIAKITGLHPYAVTMSLNQVRSFSPKWLHSAYQLVTRLDWRIKQGDIQGLDATDWLMATLVGSA